MRKRKNYIISLVMVFVFLVSLFPVTNVEAADKYGKVKHTYKNDLKISEIWAWSEGGLLHCDDKLDKGYTNVYEVKADINAYIYVEITTPDKNAFECAITDNKGKIVCEKKIKSKSGFLLKKIKKGKYYIKVRALKKSPYQLLLASSDTVNKDGKYYIDMRRYYFDNNIQSIDIKSSFGKVNWKIYYDEKRRKSKTVKNAKSVKVDKNAKYVYIFVGKVVFVYPILNIDEEGEKEGAITKTFSMNGHAAPTYKEGEFTGKYKYYLRYDYVNLCNKTVKYLRFKINGVKDEFIVQQHVKPYGRTEYWSSSFRVKNENQNTVTKVTVEYMDGSEEVLFEGEHYITWYYEPIMYS